MNRLCYFLATGFYSGKSPVMPGTAGTAVAGVLIFFAQSLFPALTGLIPELIFAVLLTALGIGVTAVVLRGGRFGPDADDPQEIVIDEFAGYAVAIITCPATLQGALLAFVLFRLFDMSKPPPIRSFERLPGAYGIVADDIVAGIAAAICAPLLLPLL